MDKDLIRKYKEDTGKENISMEIQCFASPEKDMWYVSKDAVKEILDIWKDIQIPSQEYVRWLEGKAKEEIK